MIYRCAESGNYLLRQDIPADIQEFVGKKVIRRSLGTSDPDKARAGAAGYAAEYEDLFRKLRSGRGQTIDAGIISYLLYCLRDQV